METKLNSVIEQAQQISAATTPLSGRTDNLRDELQVAWNRVYDSLEPLEADRARAEGMENEKNALHAELRSLWGLREEVEREKADIEAELDYLNTVLTSETT